MGELYLLFGLILIIFLIFDSESMKNKSRKRRSRQKSRGKDFTVYYFAYGSNMNHIRLQTRVGKVENLGKGVLKEFELVFNTGTKVQSYANIVPNDKSIVEGVIYKLTGKQIKRLDNYEKLYLRRQLKGFDKDGNEITLEVYIDNLKNRDTPNIPAHDYMQHILIGAYANKLSKPYTIMLINQQTI